MAREFYIGLGKTQPWHEVPNAMSLTYDDVLIKPNGTHVESRSETSTDVQFGPYALKIPIITAPMDTVVSDEMVRKMAALGGIGALPRSHGGAIEQSLQLAEQYESERIPCVYSIGVKNGYEEATAFRERGAKVVLIDVANGGQQSVKNLAKEMKQNLDLTVIAGNIATYDQAREYLDYGIDIARVGIGGGAVCTTREQTGVGVPQLSAVFETTESGIYVIADGGVKKPGDIAKAIAAGAKMVMIGSMLAGTDEAPGETVLINEKPMKSYRGQASEDYMHSHNIPLTSHRAAEGIATMVPARGPVEKIITEIQGGLRSSMSYVGARDLTEFEEHALFIGPTSLATQRENTPHVRQS